MRFHSCNIFWIFKRDLSYYSYLRSVERGVQPMTSLPLKFFEKRGERRYFKNNLYIVEIYPFKEYTLAYYNQRMCSEKISDKCSTNAP